MICPTGVNLLNLITEHERLVYDQLRKLMGSSFASEVAELYCQST